MRSAHFEILKGFLWVLLINTGIFFVPFKTMRKQNSASAHGIQQKLGVTMHFSKIIIIIKLQFGKECRTLLCIYSCFLQIVDKVSLKYVWLSPISFLDFNNNLTNY